LIFQFGSEILKLLNVPPTEMISDLTPVPSKEYFIQLFCTEEMIGKVVSVQDLWKATQKVSPFKMNKRSEFLFLVPPRQSVRERILEKVIPTTHLVVEIGGEK
jgi:hypothetical protein